MSKEIKPEVEVKEPTPEEKAQQVLREKEQRDLQEVSSIITQALQKYGYTLDIQHTVVLKKVK